MNPALLQRRPALGGLVVLMLALAPALTLVLPAAHAAEVAGFELVTEAEAQKDSAAARSMERTRALRRANRLPAIQVVAPAAEAGAVASPLRIAVNFQPEVGARIVPGSFRVLYGVLKLDLTERVSKYAVVSEEGAVIEQARMPAGQHRLILRVADDHGKLGEQELLLKVEQAK